MHYLSIINFFLMWVPCLHWDRISSQITKSQEPSKYCMCTWNFGFTKKVQEMYKINHFGVFRLSCKMMKKSTYGYIALTWRVMTSNENFNMRTLQHFESALCAVSQRLNWKNTTKVLLLMLTFEIISSKTIWWKSFLCFANER